MQTSPPETEPAVKRPTSVTVISWILIGFGIVGLVLVPTFALWVMPMLPPIPREGEPPVLLSTLTTLFIAAIYFVLGIAMLKGRNWGRALYIVLEPAFTIFSGVVFGFDLTAAPPVVLYIIALFFLTRPPASAFFRAAATKAMLPPTISETPRTTATVLRRMAAVVLFAIAAMFLLTMPLVFSILSDMDMRRKSWRADAAYVAILVGPMVAFLAGGAALWGWKRWRKLLGIVLTVVGTVLLFLSVSSLPSAMLDPQFNKASTVPDSYNFVPFFFLGESILDVVFSVAALIASGILLLVSQSHLDKKNSAKSN